MSHKKIKLKKKLIIAVTLVCSVCSILSSCKKDDNIDNSSIKYTDYKTAFNTDFIKEKSMNIDLSKLKVDAVLLTSFILLMLIMVKLCLMMNMLKALKHN